MTQRAVAVKPKKKAVSTKKPMKRKVCTSHIIGRLLYRNGQLFVRA